MVAGILTDKTCGEACWHAREEICRCSCYGRNHGCLNDGKERPFRTCRIKGHVYRLIGVIPNSEPKSWQTAATAVYDFIQNCDRPHSPVRLSTYDGSVSEHFYSWRAGDVGIPAFDRRATDSQMKWPEAAGYKYKPFLIWAREDLING